jgi:hypothetical protein
VELYPSTLHPACEQADLHKTAFDVTHGTECVQVLVTCAFSYSEKNDLIAGPGATSGRHATFSRGTNGRQHTLTLLSQKSKLKHTRQVFVCQPIMTPTRDFPHSPLRKRTAGGAATTSAGRPAAAVLLLLLALVVGRADACGILLLNYYNISLTLVSYNDGDDLCAVPYEDTAYKVAKNGGGTSVEGMFLLLWWAAFPTP